jgi:hypothetical protein
MNQCKQRNKKNLKLHLFNINIQINIETVLFGNDTYNDQTNSNIFEKVHFFIKQENRFWYSKTAALDFFYFSVCIWLINKGIITWCFSYWPSYRSSVCCIGVRLRLRPIQQASDLLLGQYEKHHVIILCIGPMKVFILYWQIWSYKG